MMKLDTRTFEKELRRQLDEVSGRVADHQGVGESGLRSEVDQELAESEENLIEKITFALMRIDEGTYGECTECGHAIPVARLKAKPSVSLCVDCQTRKEQKSN